MNVIRCADTIGQNLDSLINLPYWRERLIASYTTRSFAATAAQWSRIPKGHAVKIDQAPTNELVGGQVKDVESGAASISNVVALAKRGLHVVEYMPQLQGGFSLDESRVALRDQGRAGLVHFWVANWGFTEQEAINFMAANPDVVGVQWASPSSNPNTILPGSNGRTLRQANVDLSIMRADFWLPQAPPAPSPTPTLHGKLRFEGELNADDGEWSIKQLPGQGVKLGNHNRRWAASVSVGERHGDWRIHGTPFV